jgi:hypothetical protein
MKTAHGRATSKRVYACGTFDERIVVDASKDNVTVFGGLSCATWAYDGTHARVKPTTAGYALEVQTTSAPVAFVDVDFEVGDVSTPGASSIAVFANGAASLTFERGTIKAGNVSAAGTNGGTFSNHGGAAAPGGQNASAGGAGGQVSCLDTVTSSTGGSGGGLGAAGTSGSATPAVGTANAGGSTGVDCTPGTVGANGIVAGIGDGRPNERLAWSDRMDTAKWR